MRILLRMAKAAVNLSINEPALREARALNLNLSQLLERELERRLREERGRRWQEENREAIKAYNERVERDGPLNQDLISF